jgi:hypothetical protein
MVASEPVPVTLGENFQRGRMGSLPALGVIGGLLATVIALLGWGVGVEGWRAAVRLTARWSLFVFLVLFLADPLARLSRSRPILWLKGNQRGLILAFAGAHFVHLGVVLTYFALGGTVPPWVVVMFGGLGYVVLAFLVGATNDRYVAILGAQNWQRLYVFVLYYEWLIFALTYVSRVAKGPDAKVPGAVLAILAAAFIARLVTAVLWPRVRAIRHDMPAGEKLL